MIHHRSSCQSHAPARGPRAEFISVALRRLYVWSDVSIRPSDASALFFLFCSEPSVVLSRSFLVEPVTGYWSQHLAAETSRVRNQESVPT